MKRLFTISLFVLLVVLFVTELATGYMHIPLRDLVVALFGGTPLPDSFDIVLWQSRLPRALTSVLAGSSLAMAGLLMQTLFRNPLAGPSVLGVSSGSSLAVAMLLLGTGPVIGSLQGWGTSFSVAAAALVGALVILFILIAAGERLGDPVTLLVFGIMLGYFVSAVESTWMFNAGSEPMRAFVLWGMGTFAETTWGEIRIWTVLFVLGTTGVVICGGRLNPLLLGDDYAITSGVSVKQTRRILIATTGILVAGTTAFCGPVAFIGLAVPHICRLMFKTSDHAVLIPRVALCGAVVALLCDLLSRQSFAGHGLPLNAITSLMGAPVVIYLIIRNNKRGFLI